MRLHFGVARHWIRHLVSRPPRWPATSRHRRARRAVEPHPANFGDLHYRLSPRESLSLTLRRRRLAGRFDGLQALQAPFVSPPGAGYARAWWRKKDLWEDVVSPTPIPYLLSPRRRRLTPTHRSSRCARSPRSPPY